MARNEISLQISEIDIRQHTINKYKTARLSEFAFWDLLLRPKIVFSLFGYFFFFFIVFLSLLSASQPESFWVKGKINVCIFIASIHQAKKKFTFFWIFFVLFTVIYFVIHEKKEIIVSSCEKDNGPFALTDERMCTFMEWSQHDRYRYTIHANVCHVENFTTHHNASQFLSLSPRQSHKPKSPFGNQKIKQKNKKRQDGFKNKFNCLVRGL